MQRLITANLHQRFPRFFLGGLLCVLAISALYIPLSHSKDRITTPIERFRIPKFNDAGFRDWHIRGDRATFINEEEVMVEGLLIRIFSGDESNKLMTSISSPKALLNTKTYIASGEDGIVVNNPSYRITGAIWKWNGKTNDTEISKDSEIIFFEEMIDILK